MQLESIQHEHMLAYVRERLILNQGEKCDHGAFPFRTRSEHIRRVYAWAQRLISDEMNINREALLTAAIFHDSGYGMLSEKMNHAEQGAIECELYLRANGYHEDFINFVIYMVRNHSTKAMLTLEDTPLELILLMEADWMDETGALSIVWDCMMEGSKETQTFENTYEHIKNYTLRDMNRNPMVTPKAKALWQNKRDLVDAFIEHLAFDLGMEEIKPK